VSHVTDPDRPLYALQHELAAGRPVTLVGETGIPAWFRWDFGTGMLQTSVHEDGCMLLIGLEPALLDLLPDPQLQSYRFSAEVRHDESTKGGAAGIFFLHSAYPWVEGPEHFFCTLVFDDHRALYEHPATGAMTSRALVHVRHARYRARNDTAVMAPTEYYPLPPTNRAPPWRKVAVEVTPQTVRAYWEGRLLGGLSTAEIRARFQDVKRGVAQAPGATSPDLGCSPRLGLGLFVTGGSASFRRVRVEPL
jgi:serine/threonine-protein kinase